MSISSSVHALGVDLGSFRLVTTSLGHKIYSTELTKIVTPKLKWYQKLHKYNTAVCVKAKEKILEELIQIYNQVNDDISTQLVKIACFNNCNAICLENLNINWRYDKVITALPIWNFSQLQEQIFNKCVMHKLDTILVPSHQTSQLCSICQNSLVEKDEGKRVYCPNCYSIMDSDVNAAKNIANLASNKQIAINWDGSIPFTTGDYVTWYSDYNLINNLLVTNT